MTGPAFSVDNRPHPISHLCMLRRTAPILPSTARIENQDAPLLPLTLAAAALAAALLATGCAHVAVGKHPAAFATAANRVVDNSTSAYKAAIDLHDQEQVSAGVLAVEEGKPWGYDKLTPLITPEGLKARTQILDALKAYAASLSNVAAGVDSPAIAAAAKSTASGLKTLGTDINADAKGGKTGLTLTTVSADAAGSAMLAIADHLAAKRINAALPAITKGMDPQIAILCTVLTDDIDILRRESKKDSADLSRQQWLFIQLIRAKLSPLELRDEVQRLATYRKSEESNDAKLAELQSAIAKLATAHHELEVAAESADKETLSEKMADFEAAGSKLGVFYEGLNEKGSSDKDSTAKDSTSKSSTPE